MDSTRTARQAKSRDVNRKSVVKVKYYLGFVILVS